MYRIVITKTVDVVDVGGREWGVIDKRPYTKDELESVGGDKEHYAQELKEVRGYTPEVERRTVKEREVLRQTIEELDLSAVIKAVNNI